MTSKESKEMVVHTKDYLRDLRVILADDEFLEVRFKSEEKVPSKGFLYSARVSVNRDFGTLLEGEWSEYFQTTPEALHDAAKKTYFDYCKPKRSRPMAIKLS